MTCKIKSVKGHFEVYINEKFYCCADNMSEAVNEIQNYAKERGVQNEIESA